MQSLASQGLEKSWRDHLVGWRDSGCSYEQISRNYRWMGHECSAVTARRLLELPLEIVKPSYCPRASTIPPHLVESVKKHVVDLYDEDDEITLTCILRSIESTYGLTLSDYPVIRIRKEAELVNYTVRYGHSVREANRVPRMDWCLQRIDEGCSFRKHVFTDESMIQLDSNSRKSWCLSTARTRRIKQQFKHPQKVLIWGGISWKGPTPLVIMHESVRLNAPEYCKIMRDGYLEWERATYGGKSLIVQDNARCHSAKSTIDFLEREGIKVPLVFTPTHAQYSKVAKLHLKRKWRSGRQRALISTPWSWSGGALKRYIKTHWKPTTTQQLIEGVQHYWHNVLTVKMCRAYIRHIHTQMGRVIDEMGGPVKD